MIQTVVHTQCVYTVYISMCHIRSRNCLPFASIWLHLRFLVVSVLLFILVFCCPIMCLYVLSSVLCCPLRFPHKRNDRFVLTSSCLQQVSSLIYVFSVCLLIAVSNTYCVVLCFCLFVFILCTLCCQFLWIVHFWLPLRYYKNRWKKYIAKTAVSFNLRNGRIWNK